MTELSGVDSWAPREGELRGLLFLDDYGAFFDLCDRVGRRLGVLPAEVVFDDAFPVVDVPHVVFSVDADR
jgi:hypothetical protein